MDKATSVSVAVKSARIVIMLLLVAAVSLTGWRWMRPKNESLVFTTGSKSGLYHLIAGHFTQTVTPTLHGASIQLTPSLGSAQNIARLEKGEADIAIVQNDSIGNDSVRSLAGLYPEVLHLLCRSDLQIDTLSDLSGHRVCVGDHGSGTAKVSQSLIDFARVNLKDEHIVHASFDEAKTMLREERVEAAFFLVGVGSPIIEELLSDRKMSLVPLQVELNGEESAPLDARDFVEGFRHDYPYISYDAIPMMVYRGRPIRPVPSLSVQAVLVCRDELDHATAERLTRSLFENRVTLARRVDAVSFLDERQAQIDLQFPLHSGAESFYRRREPGFLAQNAESMAFVLTLFLLGFSTFGWLLRAYHQSRKNHVDEFYEEVHALRSQLRDCTTLEQLDRMSLQLQEIDHRASMELVNEKLDANDSYLIYQNMYASCELAIASAQANLRSGS